MLCPSLQVINADVPQRDYWQVVLGSAAVTQQFCTVAAAVATPVHLRLGSFTARSVLQLCAVLLPLGYTVCCIVGGHVLGGSLVRPPPPFSPCPCPQPRGHCWPGRCSLRGRLQERGGGAPRSLHLCCSARAARAHGASPAPAARRSVA
jgi:hypothetical protein